MIIKKQHSKICDIVGTEQKYYLFRDSYYGNHKGNVNPKRSNWRIWYPIICNDLFCGFTAIIEQKEISEFIKDLLPTKGKDGA